MSPQHKLRKKQSLRMCGLPAILVPDAAKELDAATIVPPFLPHKAGRVKRKACFFGDDTKSYTLYSLYADARSQVASRPPRAPLLPSVFSSKFVSGRVFSMEKYPETERSRLSLLRRHAGKAWENDRAGVGPEAEVLRHPPTVSFSSLFMMTDR
jgi:hypothetical protein